MTFLTNNIALDKTTGANSQIAQGTLGTILFQTSNESIHTSTDGVTDAPMGTSLPDVQNEKDLIDVQNEKALTDVPYETVLMDVQNEKHLEDVQNE